MAWTVEFTRTAEKQLKKLDRQWQLAILDYLEQDVAAVSDPRSKGKPLKGELRQFWRYRVGEYRVICDIQDRDLVIVAIIIGHRKSVYES